jgi:hypothetical protein
MTPDEWLADFEAKTAELQHNAAVNWISARQATTGTSSARSVG